MTKEEYFSELSSLILKYIHFYQKNIISHIIERKEHKTEPYKFYYTIIFKTCSVFESSNIIIRNFHSHPHYQVSLSILFRSIMSDIIMAEYVIIKGKSEIQKKEVIEKIYFDHISNVLGATKKTYPIVYNWSKEETDKRVLELEESLMKNFKHNQQKIKSLNQIVKEVLSSNNGIDIIKKSYILFDEYSKFEHLGAFSFNLIHRPFEQKEFNSLNIKLIEAIRIITSSLNNYMQLWDTIPFNSKNQSKEITQEILAFMTENYDNLK